MKKFKIDDVTSRITESYSIKGSGTGKFVTNAKNISNADTNSLVWVSPHRDDKQDLVENTKAKLIVCDDSIEFSDKLTGEKCFIIVDNPRLTYIKLVNALFITVHEYGIHKTASIHPEARIHSNAFIGPNTYIGKCEIGEGTVIYGNSYIYDNVKIGMNVTIHAGCVIGADGFGFDKDIDGRLHKFPHLGGVVIEDDVEIGSNTSIDRGTLDDTHISKGVKIDNFVHVAHNVKVGKNSLLIAHAMIGGSTEIGENTWIAPSVAIKDRLKIGSNVTVGLGAIVTKNIPDNEVWIGFPAKKLRDQ